MSRKWIQHRERGMPALIKLIRWIALRLGRRPARLLLYPITLYFLLAAVPQRRASQAYLRRVLDREPRWWDIARHIHCFAATILDRVFLLSGDLQRFEVSVHHSEQVLERLHKQQGCILLGSHLGSFEVLRVLSMTHADLPLKILMYQGHNQAITRLLEALNPTVAEMVINLGSPDALLKVHESVSQGDFIGILGDRVAESDKTCRCPFLGTPADFPAGPLLLAATLKVPVILFFGLYRGSNRQDLSGQRGGVTPHSPLANNFSTLRIERADGEPAFFKISDHAAMEALAVSLRATLGGDLAQLKTVYRLTLSGEASAWQLRLEPLDRQLARRLTAVVVKGENAELVSITTRESGGDYTVMTMTGIVAQ